MPGSDTTTLIITGDSSGAVAALKALGVAYQEASTATDKGKTAQKGFNDIAVPGQRDMRQLSFAALELSGGMGSLGPAAAQARSGLQLVTMAMSGSMGPIGIAIAAVGVLVAALIELATATKKAEEASLKASEGLSKEGDNLKNHADLLRTEIEYRHQLISARREDAEKQLEEVQNRTLLQNLMKGGLNVYGYEINALGKVVNAHWAETWAAAKYHEEIDKGLTKIAKYNVELETTTDKMAKLAVEQIKAAMGKTKTEMEKPTGAYVETPEDKWGKRRLQVLQENAKAGEAIERQAREDSLKFNEEYDKMLLDQEVMKFEALQILRFNDTEAEARALTLKSQALAKYSGDSLGAAIWLAKQEEKVRAETMKREYAMNVARTKAAMGLVSAMAGAINMNAEQQIKAQMMIATIHAAIETAHAIAAAARGSWGEAAQHAAAAIEYAGVAAANYRQSTQGGGGGGAPGGEVGGGPGTEGQGTSAPTTTYGPMTNYFFSSVVVNGNLIGLDRFFEVLEEWWLSHIRASGSDVNRG